MLVVGSLVLKAFILQRTVLISVFLLILFTLTACTSQESLTNMGNGGLGAPIPLPMPLPSPTPPPSSSGFDILSGYLAGHYNDESQFCTFAKTKTSQCITLNGYQACAGFGPCDSQTSPNFVTPVPSPTPSPSPSPSPTPSPSPVPTPSPTPVPTPTPTPPPSGNFCGAFSDVRYVDYVDGSAYNPPTYTRNYFPFTNDTVIVVRVTFPLGFNPVLVNTGSVSVAEYGGPPTARNITLSHQACDFRATDPSGVAGPISSYNGGTVSSYFNIGGTGKPQLLLGRTYYFNIRNYSIDWQTPSCSVASCDAVIQLSSPR